MRFANVAGRLVKVTDEGRGIDLEAASGGLLAADPQIVVETQWDQLLEVAAVASGPLVEFDRSQLFAPVPRPRQVFALALNYADHAAEGGVPAPEYPITFTKFPTCITGPDADIELSGDRVDWEVELVVVIGRAAHRIAPKQAWDHVAGLTAGQDISDRTVQHRRPVPQFSLGKSFAGYGPTGPYLVTPDEFTDRNSLRLGCWVNGEQVQRGTTADLVFPVAELLAELSAILPLLPGDLIFTGTPAGVGVACDPPRFLAAGDTLESHIEGIGELRNRIVASTVTN